MDRFLQAVVDSLGTGSLYALIALGIALVFGVMRLVNVAYGEIVIGSIYGAYFMRNLPWYVIVLGMIVVAVLISVLIERLAFRPLRKATPTTMLIASFAVSYTLLNLALATVGSSPKGVSAGSSLASAIQIGPVHTPWYSVVTVAAILVIVVRLGSSSSTPRQGSRCGQPQRTSNVPDFLGSERTRSSWSHLRSAALSPQSSDISSPPRPDQSHRHLERCPRSSDLPPWFSAAWEVCRRQPLAA